METQSCQVKQENMWRIVEAHWGVRSYCELSKESGIVLAVFDSTKTSLTVGAASALARWVVVGWGRNIPPHQAGHTALAQDPAFKASPLVARTKVKRISRHTAQHLNYVFVPRMNFKATLSI
jgi:hypothetical protein